MLPRRFSIWRVLGLLALSCAAIVLVPWLLRYDKEAPSYRIRVTRLDPTETVKNPESRSFAKVLWGYGTSERLNFHLYHVSKGAFSSVSWMHYEGRSGFADLPLGVGIRRFSEDGEDRTEVYAEPEWGPIEVGGSIGLSPADFPIEEVKVVEGHCDQNAERIIFAAGTRGIAADAATLPEEFAKQNPGEYWLVTLTQGRNR